MQQTPLLDTINEDLLRFVPVDAKRVVDVGCSNGSLAKAYRSINPTCEYIGIEIDTHYADLAKGACSRVICANIETISDDQFTSFFPSDVWIFGDSLEHLYDPWAVLKRLREHLTSNACVVACVPNAQHWSMQVYINAGLFRYADNGLYDRTHIRWFSRVTLSELFTSCGYKTVDGYARVFDEPDREKYLPSIMNMAQASGINVERAVNDSKPQQWIVKAVPV
jgi:2-polyprenyl-3-methyl-5-hydroxy-6-metoxy-1,4-benzoquinol methylase